MNHFYDCCHVVRPTACIPTCATRETGQATCPSSSKGGLLRGVRPHAPWPVQHSTHLQLGFLKFFSLVCTDSGKAYVRAVTLQERCEREGMHLEVSHAPRHPARGFQSLPALPHDRNQVSLCFLQNTCQVGSHSCHTKGHQKVFHNLYRAWSTWFP